MSNPSRRKWWAHEAREAARTLGLADAAADTTVTSTRPYSYVRPAKKGRGAAIAVTAADTEKWTRTPGGKWIAARAVAELNHPTSHRRPPLVALTLGAAFFAALALSWHTLAVIVPAAAAAVVCVGLAVFLASRRTATIRSIDAEATSVAGIQAAEEALAPVDDLYRTWLHSWWEKRNPAGAHRRLEALRAAAQSPHAAEVSAL